MRVPLEWLKEFVAIRLTPKALAERLTMAGLEVVGIVEVEGQPVLDIEMTPNRADCLSILGVAREVAAITGQRLKPPSAQGSGLRAQGKGRRPTASATELRRTRSGPAELCGGQSPQPSASLTIRIEGKKGCARYIGRLLDGVTISPSPEWMQRRLLACGARPINVLVDITNYVLFEYGQPLHAFDFDRLAGGTILVRRAAPKEPLTTLDGARRTLSSEMLVIADARQPVAVAGVMGGAGSEVTPATRRVLLESALFDPITVRRTARALGLASESSYRFERGVDPVGVAAASARAAGLIAELAGGTEQTVCDVGAKPAPRPAITLDAARLNRWLGVSMSPATVRTTLARLSCRVASTGSGSTMRVSPPSFRLDLTQEVDLYEELARMAGYDRIPSTLPTAAMPTGRSDESLRYWRGQSLRCLCASLGLTEAIAWSLVSEPDLTRCGYTAAQAVRLANPLSQDHAFLRPSLLIGLLHAVRRNLTQGVDSVRLFETGHVIGPDGVERQQLGIALAGWWAQDWSRRERSDLFRLKGLVESLAGRLCHAAIRARPASHPWAEPGHGTTVAIGDRTIGVFGQVATTITTALDLEEPVWYAELSVEALLASTTTRAIHPPPQLPPVKRDLSVIVRDETPFEAVDRAIRDAAGTLAGSVELIDRYVGKQVPPGKHSLTFSIQYRDPTRTLTAEEVDAVHRRIGETLVQRFAAQLR